MKLLREMAGEALGAVLAPIARQVSRWRRARTFHPDGQVFEAHVERHGANILGQRLAGPALVRLSGALWRAGHRWPDALGVAVRLHDRPHEQVEALPTDQDLLFATIVSPLSMPLSPFTTDVGDYFRNHYWAVAPFDVPSLGRVKLRLSPLEAAPSSGGSRESRLRDLVERGAAGFRLEVRPTFTLGWRPVATLRLVRELAIDQAALEFSPFNVGRGLRPRGFVHALREAVYPASQRGRRAA